MSKQVVIPEQTTVAKLAAALELPVTTLMAELMKNGVMATINDTIDYETAAIVAGDLGFELAESDEEAESAAKPKRQRTILPKGEGDTRPPIVAVMGHVDHGKTTLLDAFRDTNIADKEAGGITQHVSAYQVTYKKRAITFLDTPGHEAFSLLREHGADLTDVAIIVVAADDGIKPQTLEAINFAQKAGVKMVIAVNKIDKPDADPSRIRQQLSEHNLIPEEWGGDVVVVDISAKQKLNLDKLLEMVLLVADLEDLRARVDGPGEGTVIESQIITGKGSVATILVEQGVLEVGDYLVAGHTYCKVRSLEDFSGKKIKKATFSMPVAVSGWKEMPSIGDRVYAVKDEKTARIESVAAKEIVASRSSISQPEALTAAMKQGQVTKLLLVVKADVDGSLNSLIQSIEMLGNEEVRAEVVANGVGPVTESDVTLAESAGAWIVGFNVNIPTRVKQLATRSQVEIRLYRVIYELLDDVTEALSGLLKAETVEETMGELEVKGIFKTSRNEVICGGQVISGKITSDLLVRLKDGDEIGKLTNLQREQQAAKEVTEGDFCGMAITTPSKVNLKEGDKLEFFTRQTHERTL